MKRLGLFHRHEVLLVFFTPLSLKNASSPSRGCFARVCFLRIDSSIHSSKYSRHKVLRLNDMPPKRPPPLPQSLFSGDGPLALGMLDARAPLAIAH